MGPNDGEAPGRDSEGSHSQGQIHHRRRPDHQQHHPHLLVESSEKIEIKNCEKGTSIRWNSFEVKCERCWHRCENIGVSIAYPGICQRCVENLTLGEARKYA